MFQKGIEKLQEYRQNLNLAIPLFPKEERNDILAVLACIDKSSNKLADMSKFNKHLAAEYEQLQKKAPKEIKEILKREKKTVFQILLGRFKK